MASAGGFDWIDIADQIGNRYIGGRQLFDISRASGNECHRRLLSTPFDLEPASLADWGERIVVYFTAADHRKPFVQQAHHLAQDAAFGLSSEPQKYEIVAGQYCVHDPWYDSVIIANDTRKDFVTLLQPGNQVFAKFVFDGSRSCQGFIEPAGAQFADSSRQFHQCTSLASL